MFRKIILSIFAIIILTSEAQAFTVEKVSVEKSNDFILGPSKIEIFASPGESITKNISVTNRTNKEITFRVETEDFIGSKNPLNPLILLGKQKSQYSFTDNINSTVKEFTLAFGEKITIPIEINVPENTSPGGYYTSVIVSNAPDKEKEKDINGAVSVSRVGSLFFIRVKGDVKEQGSLIDFRISGPTNKFIFNSAPEKFEILYSNDGNVHLVPYGDINIENIFGKSINSIPVDAFFALPDSLRFREVYVEHRGFMFGRYKAILELNRGYNDLQDNKEIVFWVIPWIIILSIVIVVLALYFVVHFFRTRFEIVKK